MSNNLTPTQVGSLAAEFLSRIEGWNGFDRFRASTLLYPDCWATFTGYPVICRWNLETDGSPLFDEAVKALCLKAAVMQLTGDERLAELRVSPPVDEMVHAITAQFALCVDLQTDLGIPVVHMTDREIFGYTADCFTAQCYEAAGWGEPPVRYWLSKSVVDSRIRELEARYASIGIGPGGRQHAIEFAVADA